MFQREGSDFYIYQDVLAAIFWHRTNPVSTSFPLMDKYAFCEVLKEARILKLPKIEEKKAAVPTKGSKKKEEE